MGFISFEYAVLLVAAALLWHILPRRPALWLLLVANYVFYCYWRPSYGWIIGSTTLVAYAGALAMERVPDGRRRRALLVASVAFSLGMLGYFKYSNFGLDVLRPALEAAGWSVPHLELLLPTGISFYTFQVVGYSIDVYRHRIQPSRDLVHFAAYVSFFPQLVAGPIEKADELLAQLASPRRLDLERLSSAAGLIVVGLAKKLVLADRLAPFAYPMFADPSRHDSFQLLVGLVVMPMALYLDFGGYTDIARGSARLFGVELIRNFQLPFAARDPGDLWRRWHISLTRWIRDYVFVAFPGSPALSFLIPATAFGLWHGASWNFVLWGVANGLALAAFAAWRIHGPSRGERDRLKLAPFLGRWLFRLYALLLVPLFFCATLSGAARYWKGLVTGSWASAADPATRAAFALFLGFVALQFAARDVDWQQVWARVPAPVRGLAFSLLVYLLLFGAVPTARQFVYMQF